MTFHLAAALLGGGLSLILSIGTIAVTRAVFRHQRKRGAS
jgi:hypothetical protein